MLNVITISAFNDNYIWLIHQQGNTHCVVVDPGDADAVLQALQHHHLSLEAILITHHHPDHTGGIQQLVSQTSASVYGPGNESIEGLDFTVAQTDQLELSLSGLNFSVLEVPGHTRGHIAYLTADALFSGDSLFAGGCGRIFEGTAEQMFQSLLKLSHLPDNTRIFCAHEYTQSNLSFALAVDPDTLELKERIKKVDNDRALGKATVPSLLAEEKATNPFLRCHIPSIKAVAKSRLGHLPQSEVETFASIRQWKDNF